MRDRVRRRRHYCEVFSSTFSDDGKYLLASDCFGRISFFDVNACLDLSGSADCSERSARPVSVMSLGGKTRCSRLLSTEQVLYCGASDGQVHAYRWSDLQPLPAQVQHESSFSLMVGEQSNVGLSSQPVNALLAVNNDTQLVTAAGDNSIKLWDVQTSTCLRTVTGHSDYVHDVCMRGQQDNQLMTASEDGSVRQWDSRTPHSEQVLLPYNSDCARSHLGKYLSCIQASNDWLATGGGPSLGLWHISSRSLVKQLTAGDQPHESVIMLEESILAGSGSGCTVCHFSYSGVQGAVVQVSNAHTLTMCVSPTSHKQHSLVAVGGHSSTMDILADGSYIAASVSLY